MRNKVKPEIRNPKSEVRSSNSKDFRTSSIIRASGFGFRAFPRVSGFFL